MIKHTIHKMIAIATISCIGFLSVSAFAGQDSFQRAMTQRVQQAKLKLQQAEAAKGVERQKLMDEHMNMMHEAMSKMKEMKPKTDMTMQEHEDWINEHQKLMDQILGQMMEEHEMLMGSNNKHNH